MMKIMLKIFDGLNKHTAHTQVIIGNNNIDLKPTQAHYN